MKKVISLLISALMAFSFATPAYASDTAVLNINVNTPSGEASSAIYGIDLTGNSLNANGALSANLVSNNSFELKSAPQSNWSFANCSPVLSSTDSISPNNPNYEAITFDGKGTIRNNGAVEIYKNKSNSINISATTTADMGFKQDEKYYFSCYVKNVDFEGSASVYLDSKNNSKNLVKLSTSSISTKSWCQLTATITSTATEDGSLAIVFDGTGTILLDSVSLVSESSFGWGNDLWKNAYVNTDLFNALNNLNPNFVRFNCGSLQNDDYVSWKDTIGTISERKQTEIATDNADIADFYNVSNEIGTHEYLQLCEDLGATAIACVNIGSFDTSSDEFTNCTQDVIDLVEYANGDSLTSYWGALRATNGHNESFGLKYIQLSGDNIDSVKKEIESKYPDIEVLTDGFETYNQTTDYGEMITKNNMASALLNAQKLLENEGGATNFLAYANTIEKINANLNPTSLIWFDSQDLVLTPDYYAQMLFSNNTGAQIISTSLADENITQSVSVDSDRQVLYIKLVNNSASSSKLNINLDGIDAVNRISNQYISNGYKSASNELSKQRIAPVENEIDAQLNFTVSLKANSVNVIRVAYGENNGEGLYKLPDNINLETKNYIPTVIKVVIAVLCVSIPIGAVLGYLIYSKSISKKKRDER